MKLFTKLLVSAAVLGIFCSLLIATSMWDPSVVSFTRYVFGNNVALQVDTKTRGGVKAGEDWVNEARDMSLDDVITKAKDLPLPEVKRIPKYDRVEQFGTWAPQKNGCNTRQMILARDMKKVMFAADRCTVLTGTLNPEPYTGKSISFTHDRSGGDSQAVQIDHIVPLSVAWQMGAYDWTQEKRAAFANDPVNLLATDGPANNKKSDKTPDRWMPSNKAYQCTYAKSYVNVNLKYDLHMDTKVNDFLVRTLEQC